MKHQHSLELANALSVKCSEYLAQKNLPATPINYAVAYEIACGKNSALKQAAEQLSEGNSLDNYITQDLFITYIDNQKDNHEILLNQVSGLLEKIGSSCKDSSDTTEKYQKHLEVSQRALAQNANPDKLIAALAKATRLVITDQKKLYDRLKLAEQEVQSLKQDLEKLEIESTTDSLSQLANRQGLKKIVTKRPLEQPDNSIIIFDIDHFKKINDSFGHNYGDNVIKHVAAEIKNLVRGIDITVRWGGEEFMVVLRDTDLKGAILVANKIRKSIKELRWKNTKTGEQLPPVTVSGGITQLRFAEQLIPDLDAVIHRADEALYKAKRRGRDRICY